MIKQSIASAHKSLDVVCIPGPWEGANDEKWEIEIYPFASDDFQTIMEEEKIKPRSLLDRSNEVSASDTTGLFSALAKTKGAKAAKRVADRGQQAIDKQQEATAKATRQRAEITAAGFDYADYPNAVLDLDEIARLREAIATKLVAKITTVDADEKRTKWSKEQIAADFASEELVPDTIPRTDEDGVVYVEALYLRGVAEGTALAAWVVLHAVQTHRFLERRGPLGSESD